MKHDAQGFLLGERIGAAPVSASPAIAILGSVRRDVSVIRRLMESRVGRVGSTQPSQRSGSRAAVSRPELVAALSSAVRSAAGRSSPGAARQAAVAMPVQRDSRGRFMRAVAAAGGAPVAISGAQAGGAAGSSRLGAAAKREEVASDRDARGRFAGGGRGGGGGGSDYAGENIMAKIADSMSGISDAVNGAENIDPTIAALKEVRDVVSPVGRGFMALQNRMAERKKERWYSRILKAITGRKGEASGGGGGAGDVGSSSFLGTFLGETVGKMAGRIPALLMSAFTRILAPVALLWASWEIGQWIGGKINEWLEKSGIAAKVFDAFDSVGKWFKDKFEVFKPAGKRIAQAQVDVAERVSRNVSSGTMNNWGRAKKNLIGAAEKAGVDPGIVAKIAAFESGFSPTAKAQSSTAHGYGQFLDDTWEKMINKYGGKYGVAGAGGLSKAQTLGLRGDEKLQAAMLAEFTRENVGLGRKLGGANDDANVYALHNLGAGDGSKFLKALAANPGAPVSSVLSGKVISNNKSLYADGSISVADAYRRMGSKMSAGNIFAAEATASMPSAIKPPSVAAVPSSTVPGMRPATVPMSVPDKPAITQAATVPESLSRAQRSPTVVLSKEDVGQDLRNRKAANIVTGGIGG